MPYPDNFRWDTFERRHGPRKGCDLGDVTEKVRQAIALRDAAIVFLSRAEGVTGLDPSPIYGYDVEDVLGGIKAAAGIDIAAYRARLMED